MIDLRPFSSLGTADHGWLKARHHFSFSAYRDPRRMNWGRLRVWNDDVIAPRSGFPTHGHQDMEIITYVREGAITHRDSLGNIGRTGAGDVQVMSAGTGVTHSEFNMEDVETRIFQIWILPDQAGGQPAWGARPFPKSDRTGRFGVLASGMAGDEGALPIRAQARVLGATLRAGERVVYPSRPDRFLYLAPALGRVRLGDTEVNARDGVAIAGLDRLELIALEDSELVLVDTA